jgi:hypothetical protein
MALHNVAGMGRFGAKWREVTKGRESDGQLRVSPMQLIGCPSAILVC